MLMLKKLECKRRERRRGVGIWVVCCGLLGCVAAGGRVVASDDSAQLSVALGKSEQLLKRAGASPDVLTRFERDWREQWPEDALEWAKYLQDASPEEVAQTVADLSSAANDQYALGSDSVLRAGVPRGETFTFTLDQSRVFPGTSRRIRVYVPAQYRGDRPACVYVQLDDLFLPNVAALDNLISRNELPVVIAIGVSPGMVKAANTGVNPRMNRSFEFDGLSDSLARFLLEEVFPEVERHTTASGVPIRLSRNGNDRAAGGISTGGIAAFTLAWSHPSAFSRVFTGIGTFVGMRGGDRYPVLVRKTEPKPIRIFMQDGSRDGAEGLGEVGDWWMGNQTMQRALEFAGYQVRHVWGEGTHDGAQALALFPEAMRWLWKDWPEPVESGASQNNVLKTILQPGEPWQSVVGDYASNGALTADPVGDVLFWDDLNGKAREVSRDGQLGSADWITAPYADMAFGPDGRAYVTERDEGKIVAYANGHKPTMIAEGLHGAHLVVTHPGTIYVTEPGSEERAGGVWLVQTSGHKVWLDGGMKDPTGVTLSPDGLWLAVADGNSHWGYSYQIESDGTVQDRQRFYWFHVPDDADDSGAQAWTVDRDGYLYAATRMGVQVFDRNGRVRAILPVPGGAVIGLAFGGPNRGVLYVSCADHKLYRRRLKAQGAPSWDLPIKLPKWDAG